MATPNYGFEKRQKELAKKRKKEDKLKQKAERKQAGQGDDPRVPLDQEPGDTAADSAAPDAGGADAPAQR